MLSLLMNTMTKRITLIFPSSQKLWIFFSLAEVKEFRIESSKHVFTGKLQREDIELAKQKLGACEV
jgi:hypothetical protein